MKLYSCGNCSKPIYFENVVCTHCGHQLSYLATEDNMYALPPGRTDWHPPAKGQRTFRYCDNHAYAVCNWLVPTDVTAEENLCEACSLNRTVPNFDDPDRLAEWRRLELAKHRLVYTLLRLGLPVAPRMESPDRPGIAFDFLSPADADEAVMTGHDRGLVTINADEADPVARETNRVELNERYRTLVGHFRHEIGHYYWDRLIATSQAELGRFRGVFGDERTDYGEALQRHYRQGPPANWAFSHISPYATAHPWEDWAETWAHYLHLLDLLDTSYSLGLQIAPAVDREGTLTARVDFDPFAEADAERIVREGVAVAVGLNSLNRSLGRPDLYPFVISDPVRGKLAYVHRLVRSAS